MCCRGIANTVLHWNYRGFTEFPFRELNGEESDVTDIYLKENLISSLPKDIVRLERLESLYLSGNDIEHIPAEIGKLFHLKCLDLSGNRLRRVPEEIGDVKNLKFLILDDNELTELPLRLSELRGLRYLSVCDNKLRWLPQRPVHNYHHCEFRFWRNQELKAIPYSLWYHMFRDQPTRTLNIGCLGAVKNHSRPSDRKQLKFQTGEADWKIETYVPTQYSNVLQTEFDTPPTLLELSKRILYNTIYLWTKEFNNNQFPNTYSNGYDFNGNLNNSIENLSKDIEVLNTHNDEYLENKPINNFNAIPRKKCFCTADFVDKYYGFLPKFLKKDLCYGPISKCENVTCKVPVFDYVHVRFCIGKILLIDERTEDTILSAVFCSKKCANYWQTSKDRVLSWRLIYT